MVPTFRVARVPAQTLLNFAVLCLCAAPAVYGQTDPWSQAAGNLATAFTGPIAKGLSLVAIVLGGITIGFSEGNQSRVVGGLVFGCGLALGAANFLTFITG
jgi:type IV secretory pathway VirB2 component (pilin)